MATLPQTIHLATPLPGPEARALDERAGTALPRALTAAMPTFARRTDRGVLEDVDGNRLIDFGSGIAVTTVGGAAAPVAAAIQEQAENLTHTSFAVTRYAGYIEVAERLNALTPGSFPKKTALFNSGAEAVENAIKLARRHTGRQAAGHARPPPPRPPPPPPPAGGGAADCSGGGGQLPGGEVQGGRYRTLTAPARSLTGRPHCTGEGGDRLIEGASRLPDVIRGGGPGVITVTVRPAGGAPGGHAPTVEEAPQKGVHGTSPSTFVTPSTGLQPCGIPASSGPPSQCP